MVQIAANRPSAAGARNRGLTLVELLVAVAVVGVLLAIALPALSSARKAARLSKCIANARELALLTQAYAADFRDQIPCAATTFPQSDDPYEVGYYNPLGMAALRRYADLQTPSISAICPDDFTTDPRMVGTDKEHRPASFRSYAYSKSLFVQPRALDPRDPQWRGPYLRPVSFSRIAFPSRKCLIREQSPFHESWLFSTYPVIPVRHARYTVAAADGSVEERRTQECVPGVALPQAGGASVAETMSFHETLNLTPYGADGVDWPADQQITMPPTP